MPLSVTCEGGARFTGASDSLKVVSGRSTGGIADPPKTPARRNRTNIRQCRFTATSLQVLGRVPPHASDVNRGVDSVIAHWNVPVLSTIEMSGL